MENLDLIRKKVGDLLLGFKEIEPAKYSMNGITTETIIFEYENSKFVYVPGKKEVVLGWDAKKRELPEEIIKDLKAWFDNRIQYYQTKYEDVAFDYQDQIEEAEMDEDYENASQLRREMRESLEYISEERLSITFDEYLDKWYSYLIACMSPIRKADISDMLVEIDSNYVIEGTNFNGLISRLKRTPFDLPTEDEWEYLCNGGTRTMFRWGNSLALQKEVDEMYTVGSGNVCTYNRMEDEKTLEKPNMFGLHISYDSYRFEIVNTPDILKGGDGGCSLCGGEDLMWVAPTFTAFYRKKYDSKNESFMDGFYTYRKIIRV